MGSLTSSTLTDNEILDPPPAVGYASAASSNAVTCEECQAGAAALVDRLLSDPRLLTQQVVRQLLTCGSVTWLAASTTTLFLKLAKVDATEHKELGTKFGVKGYPTLKFFKNGVAQDYTGGRTADTIVQWLDKKTGPAAKSLEPKEDADNFVSDNQVAVIGFFKDPIAKEAVAFASAADLHEDVNFAITSNSAVFSQFAITDDAAVILLKKFDEGRNNLEGDITSESVTEFVNSNYLPLVVDFNTDTAKQIFQGSYKNHFIMFQSASAEKFEHNLHNARKVAKDFRGDIMFVSVTTDEAEHKKVVEFFGITDDEIPNFRLTASTDDMVKYKPDDASLSEENIRAFIKSFK